MEPLLPSHLTLPLCLYPWDPAMEDGTLRGDLVDQDSEGPFLTRGDLAPMRLIGDPREIAVAFLELRLAYK